MIDFSRRTITMDRRRKWIGEEEVGGPVLIISRLVTMTWRGFPAAKNTGINEVISARRRCPIIGTKDLDENVTFTLRFALHSPPFFSLKRIAFALIRYFRLGISHRILGYRSNA